MITSLILLTLSIFIGNTLGQKNLYPIYDWYYLDYEFPTPAIRTAAITNKQYIKGNSFPLDFDVHYGVYGNKHFVTMPRLYDGTPFTLGIITPNRGEGGPIIAPYPNYDWQQTGTGTNCKGLTSVFRVFVDTCDRLWVMDTGIINDIQVCPPQLVIFNLNTNSTDYIYKFPTNLVRPTSLFITPIVDVRGTCVDTKVYIADVTGFGIVIFDYKTKSAWRAENNYFNPYSSNSTFKIAGESFDLMDGIFGMSLSPKTYAYNNRFLYFHGLASISEVQVPLSILDNAPIWQQNPKSSPSSFQFIGTRQNSQSTVEGMDKNGNMFFGTLRPLGVACWNSNLTYTNNLKLIVQNDNTLQFISGLKIVANKNEEEMWVMSNAFQRIFRNTRNINVINYRVQAITVKEVLGGYSYCNGPAFPYYK